MRVSERFKKDIAIVAIKGNLLDENDDAILQEEINSLTIDNIKRVILDFSMVNQINNLGLNALVSAFTKLRHSGGDMRLARIDKQLHDILAMTKMVRMFSTYETVDRALASYGR